MPIAVLVIEESTLLDSMSVSGVVCDVAFVVADSMVKTRVVRCQARCPMNMLSGTDYMTLSLSS